MFKQATHHATAIALAALTTLATLAGLDTLATGQYATAQLVAQADAEPAAHQVVVTARRISQA
jgi:hypothetical protein